MNGKYLSVAEFAEKAGVSKQTIYDQMAEGKRLAPYKKKINGKKMIRSDALSYYMADSERTPETTSSPPPAADPDDSLITILREQLKVKDQQLAEKDKQLAARDAEIQSLTEAIKATTAVQYRLQDQLKLLTGDDTSNPVESTPEAEKPSEPPSTASQEHSETTGQSTGGFWGWFRSFIGR